MVLLTSPSLRLRTGRWLPHHRQRAMLLLLVSLSTLTPGYETKKETDQGHISKLLRSPCSLWPTCLCGQTMEYWQTKMDDDLVFNLEETKGIEITIFAMLNCVAHNCPEAKVRDYAATQLRNTWWDRQRARPRLTKRSLGNVEPSNELQHRPSPIQARLRWLLPTVEEEKP